MTYASICDGIGAVHVAWQPLGWTCKWVSEIEKFPSAVVEHHWGFPNLGDVYGIKVGEVNAGKIDLIVAGFPCQDLSIAGLRKGLRNEDGSATRSGIFFAIADICDAVRQRWTVLENVPGLLSSNDGEDFRTVVGTLCGADFPVPREGWRNAGFAAGPKGLVEWFVLDAQYVRVESHPRAVPQRRRRVFIVRDSGNWQRRPPLLAFPHCLSGNPPPRRETGEGVAPTLSSRPSGGGGLGTDFDCDGGLIPSVSCAMKARDGKGPSSDGDGDVLPLIPVSGMGVRRLTPECCEALQGFPRGYTAIPYRNKTAADGPRYKALGNSMAVNCMRWIGQRIQEVDQCVTKPQ